MKISKTIVLTIHIQSLPESFWILYRGRGCMAIARSYPARFMDPKAPAPPPNGGGGQKLEPKKKGKRPSAREALSMARGWRRHPRLKIHWKNTCNLALRLTARCRCYKNVKLYRMFLMVYLGNYKTPIGFL